MAASTAARYDLYNVNAAYINYVIKSGTTVYYGTAVGTDTNGFLLPMSDAAVIQYRGICRSNGVNGVGGLTGDGTLTVQVEPAGGLQQFYFVSPAQTNVGEVCYFTDDHTVAASSSNSNIAGTVEAIAITGASGAVVVNTSRRAL